MASLPYPSTPAPGPADPSAVALVPASAEGSFGISAAAMPAVDAMALSLLALVVGLGLAFGFWAYRIGRRSARPDPVGEFLEALGHEVPGRGGRAGPDTRRGSSAPSWSRPDDWWRR